MGMPREAPGKSAVLGKGKISSQSKHRHPHPPKGSRGVSDDTEGNSPQRHSAAEPQPNRPRARRRARARSAVASTGPGLSVRFVPPALSAGGLAEMRFVRHLLARRWVGRASRRASFQAVQRWLSASGSTEARRSLRPPDVSSFCELQSFSRLCPPSKD